MIPNKGLQAFPHLKNEIDTSDGVEKGFNLAEAKRLLELCIELNRDPGENIAFDTSDYENVGGFIDQNKQVIGRGPFDNAWKLWRRKGSTDEYAIVIRGTKADARSIIDDVLATSVAAEVRVGVGQGKVLDFVLSGAPGAEVHLGFVYGLAVLMFDNVQGILNSIKALPPGSKLYITGHSQGAAIATLVHAFLHYAINDPSDRYGLRDKHFALKSYFFAQPKPGNWQLSMDFSRIAASKGTSYVINNSLDWVPQVPLTIEFLSEPVSDLAPEAKEGDPGFSKVLGAVSATMKSGRSLLAGLSEDGADGAMVDYEKKEHRLDSRYFVSKTKRPRIQASSVNYWSCGNLVPVFGSHEQDSGYDHDGWLTQHHGPTYRALIRDQLR